MKKHVSLPIIASGGVSTGRSMLAAFILGADCVIIGSSLLKSSESAAPLAHKLSLGIYFPTPFIYF